MRLSLRAVFFLMEKIDKIRHAFMDGGGHVEKGGNMQVSLLCEQGGTQCAWMEPSTLVVMTAERLHGTVSLRWSSAWPKREGNQSKGSC